MRVNTSSPSYLSMPSIGYHDVHEPYARAQGDEELKRFGKVSVPFHDRSQSDLPKCQIGFMQ